MGYQVIPGSWLKRGRFYYQVVMEELSDRVVITVLDGVKQELETDSTHKQILHDLIDHHRALFAQTFAEILQDSLAEALKTRRTDHG